LTWPTCRYIFWKFNKAVWHELFSDTFFEHSIKLCYLIPKIIGYNHQVQNSLNFDTSSFMTDETLYTDPSSYCKLQIQNYIDHSSHLGLSLFLIAKINSIFYLFTCSKKFSHKSVTWDKNGYININFVYMKLFLQQAVMKRWTDIFVLVTIIWIVPNFITKWVYSGRFSI
jgi:hypothetical protein